jgi:N-acetylmuramoyl-L-alanine amidase
MLDELVYTFPKLKNRGPQTANFTVLGVNCYSMLIEFLFQDNKEDVALLKDATTNEKFEEAVVYSVMKFDKKLFG